MGVFSSQARPVGMELMRLVDSYALMNSLIFCWSISLRKIWGNEQWR